MKCWEAAPDDRPSFKELHTTTSKYIECIAGYLEMGFNPFGGVKQITTTLSENDPKDEEVAFESTVSVLVIPPSVDTSVAESALTNNID